MCRNSIGVAHSPQARGRCDRPLPAAPASGRGGRTAEPGLPKVQAGRSAGPPTQSSSPTISSVIARSHSRRPRAIRPPTRAVAPRYTKPKSAYGGFYMSHLRQNARRRIPGGDLLFVAGGSDRAPVRFTGREERFVRGLRRSPRFRHSVGPRRPVEPTDGPQVPLDTPGRWTDAHSSRLRSKRSGDCAPAHPRRRP